MLLAGGNGVLALFAVADTVKDSSREAIAELHRLGVKTVMLSGDNPTTARHIADAVGMDDARGDQLPEDKAAVIATLSVHGVVVGMVGDGINDAPALARADIDDLRKIPLFVSISQATATVLKQNIAVALGIKAVFLGLTLAGHGTMWMAVFADMGASLIVVFNGLRLLRL